GYLEVYSAAPFTPGFTNFGPEDSELPISFSAVPVPEPVGLALLAAGGGVLGVLRRRTRAARPQA
ncbi:MAG TPA: PEP-CTERM sorting domain-containing protein, partial [Plasticicumulans sp.]|uniref:PEP-CTERM sorting domain-containing protein n=1 Tax=Plasticicumulans sp. TaxID=2307179 RepID=UPI002C64AD0C